VCGASHKRRHGAPRVRTIVRLSAESPPPRAAIGEPRLAAAEKERPVMAKRPLSRPKRRADARRVRALGRA